MKKRIVYIPPAPSASTKPADPTPKPLATLEERMANAEERLRELVNVKLDRQNKRINRLEYLVKILCKGNPELTANNPEVKKLNLALHSAGHPEPATTYSNRPSGARLAPAARARPPLAIRLCCSIRICSSPSYDMNVPSS